MVCTRETLLPYVANAEIFVRKPNFELKFGWVADTDTVLSWL